MRKKKLTPASAADLGRTIIDYAKQETIVPIKSLGRFLLYGLIAAVFTAIGAVTLLIGLLRALQTETGTTFTGNLTWAPYLLTLVLGSIFLALAIFAIGAPKRRAAKRSA